MLTPERPAETLDLTGRELGDYRVLRRIGVGGMAEVYLADQLSLGRQVAMKVLLRSLAADATYVERFMHEARAVAALSHANIVQIHEVGQIDGYHFIVQEYVRGKNLAEVLKREGALQPRLVLDVLRQVTAALAKADEAGIVHRDLKPENILLSYSGEVKVADFGLARLRHVENRTLTQAGVTMGTPLYMSPEQIEGRPVDCRSDIYSLGVTCYHLLTGHPPHQGDTALAIALQHLNVPPRPLENLRDDIPSSMARIVHRMIAKKPEQRYGSPGELLAELRKLAAEAAKAGWGEGPDQWSLADWVASADAQSRHTRRLGELMQASDRLSKQLAAGGRRTLVVLAALAAGAGAGAAMRPKPYLQGAESAPVESRESAWAQLFQAKMTPSEAAWIAARDFPEADPYVVQLANQGLLRYYLFISEDFRKAAPLAQQLADDYAVADSSDAWRAFAYASLCVAEQRLGDKQQAAAALARLTPELRDDLRRRDNQLYELLEAAEKQLGL